MPSTEVLPSRRRRSALAGTPGAALLALALLLGCGGREPIVSDVDEPAAESDADAASGEHAEAQATPDAGPGGWTCALYDEHKEEGTELFDAAITDEAEAYVAGAVRASLTGRDAELPADDGELLNRIRGELAILCGGDPTLLLSEAAARIADGWTVEPAG